MELTFYKYHGTGNDFIMIDNRSGAIQLTLKQINLLCDRRFGIGADGLILIETSVEYDFYMRYFNADGAEGTMCGNGGRCSVHFARQLGLISAHDTTFEAADGKHKAVIHDDMVALNMQDVTNIEWFDHHCFLDTGSPHHIEWTEEVDNLDVYKAGKAIRYGLPYGEEGTNVNFVTQIKDNVFQVRTYERGVEDETLSCGTGVTATAIAMYGMGKTKANVVRLITKGGQLEVSFVKEGSTYKNVVLKGPATFVFKGVVEIAD